MKFFSNRFIKFCIAGFSGVFVNEAILFILTEFAGLLYLFSSLIAIEASIISNFLVNDIWAFKDLKKRGTRNFILRISKWNLARILTGIVNLAILYFLTEAGINYLISNLIGIIIATILAYSMSLSWVWKKSDK